MIIIRGLYNLFHLLDPQPYTNSATSGGSRLHLEPHAHVVQVCAIAAGNTAVPNAIVIGPEPFVRGACVE